MAVLGAGAALAFANAGRAPVAIVLGFVAICAAGARRWFLRQLDAQVRARDGGDASAIQRLRQLHLRGIAYNAVQLAALVVSIPRLFPGA